MSRIGKKPVALPAGLKVDIKGNSLAVEGPKGKMSMEFDSRISIENKDNEFVLSRANEQKETKALHGLYRVLVSNMVTGVMQGYEKRLEINGTGFKAAVAGQKLTLNIGFSHPVVYDIPEGVKVAVEDSVKLVISGVDKHLVGHVAAVIRDFRPCEPYKAKGIRYSDEVVRRKAGKAAKK
ncbi:MAG: 50S ribosomal protein L6 [Treponema sp.]|nr:50S ribosomal protein L6 [Treponema sp.]